MSGRVNYMCALAFLHCILYSWYAASVSLCFLPLIYLHLLYDRFASLQMSLYHGARCLAHRFGFAATCFVCLLATPIFSAWSIKNCSMYADRVSLSPWCCFITSSKASPNSFDAVYSFHLVALSMYFSPSPAPTHSIVSFFRADTVLLVAGWWALVASKWSVMVPLVVWYGVVLCGCGVVVAEI